MHWEQQCDSFQSLDMQEKRDMLMFERKELENSTFEKFIPFIVFNLVIFLFDLQYILNSQILKLSLMQTMYTI